jgi:hypothetical protein
LALVPDELRENILRPDKVFYYPRPVTVMLFKIDKVKGTVWSWSPDKGISNQWTQIEERTPTPSPTSTATPTPIR